MTEKSNKDRQAFPGEGSASFWRGMTKREHLAPQAPPRPLWFEAEKLEGEPIEPEKSFEYDRRAYSNNHYYQPSQAMLEEQADRAKNSFADDQGYVCSYHTIPKDGEEAEMITQRSHLWDEIMFDEKKMAKFNAEMSDWTNRNYLHADIQWAYYWADAMLGESLVAETKEENDEQPKYDNTT